MFQEVLVDLKIDDLHSTDMIILISFLLLVSITLVLLQDS